MKSEQIEKTHDAQSITVFSPDRDPIQHERADRNLLRASHRDPIHGVRAIYCAIRDRYAHGIPLSHAYPKPEPMPHTRAFWIASGLVTALVLLFSIYFIALLTARQDAFMTNAEDLGIMDQVIWNTLHGHLLKQTICDIVLDTNCGSPAGITRFAIHFDPLLIPLSGLYLIWANPKTLLIVQTLIVAIGAYPAFWLTRLRLRSNAGAVAIAALYLLYPTQQQALTFDFHAVTLTCSFLLFMLYFMYTRRTKWIFIFAILSLLCKEEISLIVAAFGLWTILFQGRRILGLTLIGIAMTCFCLALFVIMPHFSPTGHPLLASRYDQLGGPKHFLATLVLHPQELFNQYVREPGHLAYLKILFSPALFLPLLAPWILILALPSIAINLLSSNPQMYSGIFQYNAEIVPIIIFATIEALVVIEWLAKYIIHHCIPPRYWRSHKQKNVNFLQFGDSGVQTSAFARPTGHGQWGVPVHRLQSGDSDLKPLSTGARPEKPGVRLLFLMLILSAILIKTVIADIYFYGQLPFSQNFVWPQVTNHMELAQRFIDMIPANASVSAQSKLVPHLSQREDIYLFPYADDRADYIFLDVTSEPTPYDDDQQYMREVQKVLLSGHYGILAAQDGYLLLKRGLPAPKISPFSPMRPGKNVDPNQVLLDLPQNFCSYASPQPEDEISPTKVNFTTPDGGSLQLRGYQINLTILGGGSKNLAESQTANQLSSDNTTVQITTYWQMSKISKIPLRLLFILQDKQGKPYLLSADAPTMSWCPTTNWREGEMVRIETSVISLQGTKVPGGPAHLAMALLPLAQSSHIIIDGKAWLPLQLVSAPSPIVADPKDKTLQLMYLQIR